MDGYDGLYAAVEGLLESAGDRAFGTASVAANDILDAGDAVNPEAPAGEADGAAAEPEEAAQAAADGADLVKTDGTYLYYLANGELYVVAAAGADTALLSRVAISLQKDAKRASRSRCTCRATGWSCSRRGRRLRGAVAKRSLGCRRSCST